MTDWQPTRNDPLLILAMDHRESFGRTIFGVTGANPTAEQSAAMRAAKDLIFSGLQAASTAVSRGRPGVLVDEQYGQSVIDKARTSQGIVLAIPVEASGHDWLQLQWGDAWLEHIESQQPDYAKVLVRDNPTFDSQRRSDQLGLLAKVSQGLQSIGMPLIYELLIPPTDEQLREVGGDHLRYDAHVRPQLTVEVIADNQAAGIEPALWKIEGLEDQEAAGRVVTQVRAEGRSAQCIVLGRDAPPERLDHWLSVAAGVDGFVGFAIGRSIWEKAITDHTAGRMSEVETVAAISKEYAHYVQAYLGA